MSVFNICPEHNNIRSQPGHGADASYCGIVCSGSKTVEAACATCWLNALTTLRIQFPLTRPGQRLHLLHL
jgi:hypothetical protein